MLRISALNDSSSSEDELAYTHVTQTKEAKEAEAFAAYNNALTYQQSGSCDYAEKLLRNLFDHPFLKEAENLLENDDAPASAPTHPGLQLLYLVHKNLAAILLQRKDLKQAMASYVEAVKIDSTEVTVWFKMGQIALKIHNYPLAKICFQQALQCNPNHWPSLDNAITVTFALGDYLMCLEHISCALEKDCHYPKGLVLRKQILQEQPSLESITKELFVYCDPQIHTITVDKEDTKEYLDECDKIRTKRRQLLEEDNEKTYRPMTFLKPLAPFTWKNVGERLIELYEFATTSDPPKSLGLEVDLRDYNFLDQSLIFGKEAVEDGKRVQKSTTFRESPKLTKVTERVDTSDCPRQGSPFQRAQEQGTAMLKSTPESLKVKDNAKEYALLQRLKGDRDGSCRTTPSSRPMEVGGTRRESAELPKTASNNLLADLEDMDVGDDFGEMPPLAEAMDISDLNLTDIQKTDFAPELFLKTNDDDLHMGNEAKSLEKVLSGVIDMEFDQGSVDIKSRAVGRVPGSERSVCDKHQEDPIPPSGISGSDFKCESDVSSLTRQAQADPSVAEHPRDSIAVTSPKPVQTLTPSLPHPDSDTTQHSKATQEASSQAALYSRPGPQSKALSCSPKNSPDITSVTLGKDDVKSQPAPPSTLASTPLVSSSKVFPPVVSSADEPRAQEGKSPVTPSLRLNTVGQHSLHSSLVASLLSPKSNAHHSASPNTPTSLYQSVLSSPSKSDLEQNTSLYSTPVASFAKQSGESKPGLSLGAHSSDSLKHDPQVPSPGQGVLFKPEAKDVRQNPQSLSTVSSTPRFSASHQTTKPVSSVRRISLSTGDLIEDVVRRQIMGPSYAEQAQSDSQAAQKAHKSPNASEAKEISPRSTGILSPPKKHHPPEPSPGSLVDPLSSMAQRFQESRPMDSLSSRSFLSQELSLRQVGRTSSPSTHSSQESTPSPMDTSSPSLEPSLRSAGISPPRAPSNQETIQRSKNISSPVRAPEVVPRSVNLTSSPEKHLSHDLPKSPYKSLSFSSSYRPSSLQPSIFMKHSMPADAPVNFPLDKREVHRERSSGSVSLPLHHINALSSLEAEALLNTSLSASSADRSPAALSELPREHRASMALERPPFWRPLLARSSSMPGSLTSVPADISHLFPQVPSVPSIHDLRTGLAASTSHVPSTGFLTLPYYYSSASFSPYLVRSPLPRLSPTLPAARKPMSLLQGSPPASLFNPFTTSIYSPLSLAQPSTSHSRAGERKSPVGSPRSPVGSGWGMPVQQVRKSPSHRANSPKQQQRRSPSHQPNTSPHLSPGSASEVFHQGEQSSRQRGELFQAMVKSMLESGNTQSHSHQQKLVSTPHSSAGVQRRTPPAGADHKSGAKRGPKRKSEVASLSDEWALAYKRRSTRSRSSRSKKEVEVPDFNRLMKQYFPQTLAVLEEEGCEQVEAEASVQATSKEDKELREKTNSGEALCTGASALEEMEDKDVKNYVKACLKGHGLLQLIHVYLVSLGERSGRRWYADLSEIYLKLYDCLRKHLTIPTIWFGDSGDISQGRLREYAIMMLTTAELCLRKVASEHGTLESMSPSKTLHVSPGPGGAPDLFGKFHKTDMNFLEALTNREDVFDQEGTLQLSQFCARFYWLQARQHQVLGQTLDAIDCFQMVEATLEEYNKDKNREKELVIVLPNASPDGIISLKAVSQMMDNMQRSRSLQDTRSLYDHGEYVKVVENLMATFTDSRASNKSSACKERPSQLLLLLDSLVNMSRLSEVMQWGEISLHEAVLHFQRAPSLQLRQDWAATLVSLFETLDKVMDKEEGLLKSLSHPRLVRLAHNLVSVIQVVLDVADTVTEMPIASVRPWKILYRVLHFEEDCIAKSRQQQSIDKSWDDNIVTYQGVEEGEIRPSLAMLIKSHEYLGRHSWCTKEEGLLLTFMMTVLGKELSAKDDDEDDDDEDASSAFEQCVYCLYNHPNKRGRARHLSDHNAQPVEMTWAGAGPVFHFFAPHTIPEFDSYKASTVSSDVEHLLRRLYTLVPEALQPGQKHTAIVEYIEGTSSVLPVASSSSPPPPVSSPKGNGSGTAASTAPDPYQICSLLYYLLGDFYFKNKEPAKAVKFYQLDLTSSPDRLDSWAGLALARMSQLVQKLNSTELKIDSPLNKKSEAALRCFRRAVALEDNSRKLWLEFGSLAYQLHSHASRQISYRNILSISGEMLHASRVRRPEMLSLAKSSYCRANECEGDGSEDDWLTHYMMGKVAEKQGEPPNVFLDCYKQAALCLHEEEALYPNKLQFTTLPPHLALEALEVFFRTQASSLKLVLSGCDYKCLLILDSFVTEALDGHFARREEKQFQAAEVDKPPELPSTPSSKSLVPSSVTTTQPVKKPKKVYHKNPVDHDYTRHKSMSDSQSEGEERKSAPAQLEDMEGSSDWSQEETSGPFRNTPLAQTTTTQDVFEISSPDANKVCAAQESPAVISCVQPQKQSGDVADAESPMECDSEVAKENSTNVSKECIAEEANKNIAEKSTEQDTNVGDTDAKSNVKGAGEEMDKPESTAVEHAAMETDAGEESHSSKPNSDGKKEHGLSHTVAPTSSSTLLQGEQKSEGDSAQKSTLARTGSLGFSLTGVTTGTEMPDNSAETPEDQTHGNAKRQESDTDSQKQTDTLTNVSCLSGEKNVNLSVNVSDGDNRGEKKETTNPSGEQDPGRDREKWELEDQEKPVVGGAGESVCATREKSPLATAGAKEEEGKEPLASEETRSVVSPKDVEKLRSEVRNKCMSGLELCAARFSCHYKSLYRLAHAYFVMKEYNKARDLLLGCPDWQQQLYMPAPGLFSERKQNNFFQGLWKIPIEDIDRSGSFASHVHRSVRLLLDVLAAQEDLDTLLHVRNQLKRTPDSGKKYLRDSERLVLSEEAYLKCLYIVERAMEASDGWSEARREENLLTVFRVWNLGKGGKHGVNATRTLHVAFKVMMKGRTDVNRLTPEQAILYCNQNLTKSLTPITSSQGQMSQKSTTEKNKPSLSAPVLNLERQEKEKSQHSVVAHKVETMDRKDEKPTEKADAASETQKPVGQTKSSQSSLPLTSSPIIKSTAGVLSPAAATSDSQQAGNIIVVSDSE